MPTASRSTPSCPLRTGRGPGSAGNIRRGPGTVRDRNSPVEQSVLDPGGSRLAGLGPWYLPATCSRGQWLSAWHSRALKRSGQFCCPVIVELSFTNLMRLRLRGTVFLTWGRGYWCVPEYFRLQGTDVVKSVFVRQWREGIPAADRIRNLTPCSVLDLGVVCHVGDEPREEGARGFRACLEYF